VSFLLKIVEGPNKGAEVALVEGVAVTVGKGDDCDIVLADPTMPDTPATVEAKATGVTVDGSPLETFHVMTLGATSFAAGPADAPWGELVWPKPAEEAAPRKDAEAQGEEEAKPPAEADADQGQPDGADGAEGEKTADPDPAPAKKKRGCACGCIVALVALLLVLAGLFWFFRDRVEEGGWAERLSTLSGKSGNSGDSGKSGESGLSAIAEKYGLTLVQANGAPVLSGNLATRRERLAATAEAYQTRPGIELDITDDESFRAAAADALFTLTEGVLKVVAATNRCLSIAGATPSPAALERIVRSLKADLPKMRDVDVSGVRLDAVAVFPSADTGAETASVSGTPGGSRVQSGLLSKNPRLAARAQRPTAPSLPVCGILTVPYPCLVMKNGTRIMEGSAVGESVILKIGADSVTITNSTGMFEWKP